MAASTPPATKVTSAGHPRGRGVEEREDAGAAHQGQCLGEQDVVGDAEQRPVVEQSQELAQRQQDRPGRLGVTLDRFGTGLQDRTVAVGDVAGVREGDRRVVHDPVAVLRRVKTDQGGPTGHGRHGREQPAPSPRPRRPRTIARGR
jgi:hypothetical protein